VAIHESIKEDLATFPKAENIVQTKVHISNDGIR
jgi:hypothetical protein